MRAYCAAFPGTRSLKKMTVAKMHSALEEAGKPIPPPPNTQSGGGKGGPKPKDDTQRRVQLIASNLMGDITDPEEFAAFISSMPIVGDSVQVLTRSGKYFEHPCASCGLMHPFEVICEPMVGMQAGGPGPSNICPDGRSQCERICWCGQREHHSE